MMDLTIELADRPGALAEMGEALGRAEVSVEGGGAWIVGERGVAHFLFEDGQAAQRALEAAGIRVLRTREVLVQRLQQDVPGQLGALTRAMADAGVNIEVLYSDHAHQLILVVDDIARGRVVSRRWMAERDEAAPRTSDGASLVGSPERPMAHCRPHATALPFTSSGRPVPRSSSASPNSSPRRRPI